LLGKTIPPATANDNNIHQRGTSQGPIRDRKRLLLATGGDHSLAQQLFNEFCEELPRDISTIRQLFAAAHWDELWEIIHRLHGSSAICGVPTLNAVIKELETKCKARNSQETDQLLTQLETEADTLLTHAYPSDRVSQDKSGSASKPAKSH
jgi:HPt (histidine-containing phosphotransfer) domain-containing protein